MSAAPKGNVHWDGRKIVRCKTLKSVEQAIAAGAIAHLIAGSITINLTVSATVWTSDTSTAHVRTSGTSTATVRTFDTSTAHVRTFGTSTATVRTFDTSTATVWTFDTSTATVRTFDTSAATVWTFDTSTAHVETSGTSTAHVETFDTSTVHVETWDTKTPLPANVTQVGGFSVANGDAAEERIRAVAEIVVADPAKLNMASWHCGTTHCVAGWGAFLAGDFGREVENKCGTATAGLILLGREAHQYFYEMDKGKVLAWLKTKLPESGK